MSSMKDIRQLADYFLKNEKMLNILVNNAGTMINKRELTSEGIEKNFATNTLGTYYLTKLMIPLLKLSNPAQVECLLNRLN
jgi:dehydrogenase/reductase SDR family protein 12